MNNILVIALVLGLLFPLAGLAILLGWVLLAKRTGSKPPTAHAEALMAWADDGGGMGEAV